MCAFWNIFYYYDIIVATHFKIFFGFDGAVIIVKSIFNRILLLVCSSAGVAISIVKKLLCPIKGDI